MKATAALLVLLLAAPAFAEQRVDLFTPDGKRAGYAIVDEQTGRIDFYDSKSRRIGWGRVDATGHMERFDRGGRRQQDILIPMGPGETREER